MNKENIKTILLCLLLAIIFIQNCYANKNNTDVTENACYTQKILKNKSIPGNFIDYHPLYNARKLLFSCSRNNINLITYNLVYMKNFFEKREYLEYLHHPSKMHKDSCRKPSHNTSDFESTCREQPKLFQAVWITNHEHPRPIKPKELDNFYSQGNKIENYEKIIWTNIDPDKFRETNKESLKDKRITIKNLADLETNRHKLLDFLISPKNHLSSKAIKYNTFDGVLIDLAKYLILETEGGILLDLNFGFYNNFNENTLKPYDFVAVAKTWTLENCFFWTKPHHPILKEILDIMCDLLIDDSDCGINELRDLIYQSESNADPTYLYSMTPLLMAYIKYNNIDSNKDVSMNMWRTSKKFNNTKIQKKEMFEITEQEVEHQKILHKLESDDLQEISDYAISYQETLQEYSLKKWWPNMFQCTDNMIENVVGTDNVVGTARSWHKGNILSPKKCRGFSKEENCIKDGVYVP